MNEIKQALRMQYSLTRGGFLYCLPTDLGLLTIAVTSLINENWKIKPLEFKKIG